MFVAVSIFEMLNRNNFFLCLVDTHKCEKMFRPSEKEVAFLNLLKSNKSEVFSQIFSNSAVSEISEKV